MGGCLPLRLSHKSITPPKAVEVAFEQFAVDGHIGASELVMFLRDMQRELDATEEQASLLIFKYYSSANLHKKHHHHRRHLWHHHDAEGDKSPKTLDLHHFTQFLLNPEINPPTEAVKQPIQDMNLPLSHYYIYASHNSYLTGNQLTSRSSTAPIAKALEDGCRVVELDCWTYKGKIMVLHGNTLTKPVRLDECLKVIKEYAFKTSDYPVIITIENHMSSEHQKEATKLIKEIIGDVVFIPPEDERPPRQFQSPEQLKNKIIISDTPPRDPISEQAAADPEAVIDVIPTLLTPPPPPEDDYSPPLSPTGLGSRAKRHITQKIGEAFNKGDAHSKRDIEFITEHELKDLIYIACHKPSEMDVKPVDNQLVPGERSIMANVSEPQLKKYIQANPDSVIEYCKTNLGRMYPFGLRFDSSNADPFVAWSHGFQIAALNTQGRDRPCWLAKAFFSSNGSCGYVKKPNFLLPESEVTCDQIASLPPKVSLKVTALVGTDWHKMFDFLKKPDFYVKIAIEGMPIDKAKKRTTTIFRSREPHWEDETFEYEIRVPELAVLRIEVWENDILERDDFVGQACFPLKQLKTGIRSVPLRSREGLIQGSKLLCMIEKTEVTASA